jgi:phospholipase/carboxylesterase
MITLRSNVFENANRLVLVLHGYGADGSDFAMPVRQMLAPRMDNTIFVLPNAPARCDLGQGRQWFELSNEMSYEELRKGLDTAGPILFDGVIKKLSVEYDIQLENINIIGFSQGAILAFEMLYFANFSHIISYSGLFAAREQTIKPYENNVLIIHGRDDMVVPYSNVALSSKRLNMIGIKHKIFSCNGIGHSISEEGFDQGVKFINEVR